MLSLHLQPLFAARGIEKPYNFLVNNGFSRHMASYLVTGEVGSIQFDTIERLCELFICEPQDLLAWTPPKGFANADSHPLSKLRREARKTVNLKQALATLPYSQLKEISEKVDLEIKGEKNK